MKLLGNGTVSLTCPEVLFLETGAEDPSSLLEGTLTLTVKRRVEHLDLHVSLLGKVEIFTTASKKETYESLNQHLHLCDSNAGDDGLDAGTHTFAFTLEVNGRLAPSEECHHGYVRYQVSAVATGLGAMGADVFAEKAVRFVSLPPGHRDTAPDGLDLMIEDHVEGLGLFKLGAWSPLFAVGGFVCADCHSAVGRSPDAVIMKSSLSVKQTTVISSSRSGLVYKPAPMEFSLYQVNHQDPVRSVSSSASGHPLCGPGSTKTTLEYGPTGGLAIFFLTAGVPAPVDVFRLRWHEDLKPTTLPDVDTPIQISHELVYSVQYSLTSGSSKGKKVSFSRGVTIASCACMLDTLVLPRYSNLGETLTKRKGLSCICALSIDEIVKEQRAWIDWHAERMRQYHRGQIPHPSTNEVLRSPLPPKRESPPSSSSSSTRRSSVASTATSSGPVQEMTPLVTQFDQTKLDAG